MELGGKGSGAGRGYGWRARPAMRAGWRTAVTLLLASLLWACQAPEPPLRVATIHWIGYQPLHLAQNQGYFGNHPIRLADFNSNVESLRAYRNGDVEVAALTLDEVLLLHADGHDARVILVLDYSQGADAIVARPRVADLAGLKGRRIGVESTAAGAYFLTRALESAGLGSSDIEILNIGAETQEQAYREGRIDALVTYEPMRTRLLKLGARELFSSKQMPGEIVDVLVARGATVDARPDTLNALVRGWFRAVAYAAARPDASARQVAPQIGLTVEDYRYAVAGMRFPTLAENCSLLGGRERVLRETAARLHAVMLKSGLLSGTAPSAELFDARVIRRLGCSGAAGAAG